MTAIAPTIPAPDRDALLTWGTWKTHGNLSALVYYGQDRKTPDAEGQPLLFGQQQGLLLGVTDQGKQAMRGGNATRFWAMPDPDAPSNQVEDAPAPTKDKAAKAPKTPHACGCGCGNDCLGTYRSGHDARHVSILRQAVLDGRMTTEQATTALAHAPKLVQKLVHSLDLARQAQAKREAAKVESDEAKAARHQAKAVRDADLAAKQAEEAKVTAKAAKPAKDAPATSAKAA